MYELDSNVYFSLILSIDRFDQDLDYDCKICLVYLLAFQFLYHYKSIILMIEFMHVFEKNIGPMLNVNEFVYDCFTLEPKR